MISISKTCVSLTIDILIHSWTSKNICSIRYTQYLYVLFWSPELIVEKTNKTAEEVRRLRRPTSCDVFGSWIQSIPGSPKWKLHILSISNGTYFFRGQITVCNPPASLEATRLWSIAFPDSNFEVFNSFQNLQICRLQSWNPFQTSSLADCNLGILHIGACSSSCCLL